VSRLSPINQVLQKTNELLDQPGQGVVSDVHVHKALRWLPERLDQVRRMMAQLVEDGALVGPGNATRGGLRDGAGRLLDVDVLGITEQGRRRLETALRPWWHRAWPGIGRPAVAWIATIAGGVVVAVVGAYLAYRFGFAGRK
jgi:hypothetical protein